MGSGSESTTITFAPGGMNLAGPRLDLEPTAFEHSETFVFLIGLSSMTGLEALQLAGDCVVFCLFSGRSSIMSFSFSLRVSYGDCIGWAFPTGPLGVPSSVFRDLWRNCDAFAAWLGATDEGR